MRLKEKKIASAQKLKLQVTRQCIDDVVDFEQGLDKAMALHCQNSASSCYVCVVLDKVYLDPANDVKLTEKERKENEVKVNSFIHNIQKEFVVDEEKRVSLMLTANT